MTLSDYSETTTLTAEQVRSRELRVRGSEGALEEVEQAVGVDRRTGEAITRPGTAYRFQTATGENVTMLPDPGWGSAPDGLPPQPAPPRPRGWNPESASPAAARDHLAAATADARRRLSDRQEDLQRVTGRIDDPTSPITSRDLSAQAALIDQVEAAQVDIAAAGRRALFRERPAPWKGGAGPSWENEDLRRRWSSTIDEWRRLVAPHLVSRQRPPRILESLVNHEKAFHDSSHSISISLSSRPNIVLHELSHLLEADPGLFAAARSFLSRRTAGDPLTVVDSRGSLGRRDAWRRPDGGELNRFYPGRVYPATVETDATGYPRGRLEGVAVHPEARFEGDDGDVDIRATELFSMGLQYLWEDPLAFAAADPEYFNWVWETAIQGL